MMSTKLLKNVLNQIETLQAIVDDNTLHKNVEDIIDVIVECYKNGGKVLFCGNGGSAAQAQHLAAELSGRYYLDRGPLFAEALHVNSSYLTAVANDYSYDEVFERLVGGMGKEGDVLIGLSTSGGSSNVLRALRKARNMKMITIGMCGDHTVSFNAVCDHVVGVQSQDVPRIQEAHLIIGHTICESVENSLFDV